MSHRKRITGIILATACISLLISEVARAQLGEKVEAIDKLAKKLGSARQAVRTQLNFTVHEVVNPGLTLREYTDKDGVIFAVAWDGLSQPDLAPILGSYFEDFSQNISQSPKPFGRKSQSEVQGEKVTVVKWGHMRSAHGKAFVAAKLPEGVKAEDIQ